MNSIPERPTRVQPSEHHKPTRTKFGFSHDNKRTAQHTQQARHLMEIRFSVLVVLIVFLALNAAVQLSTLAAVQGLATQQHAVSPPGTDTAALEIALNERRLAFVLATDAKFDEPINPDQKDRKLRLASNRWCTKWGETTSRDGSNGGCSAANVVLMNDVDMVIEIAKELGWKDDLKPVAVFGSKAWLDNPYNSEATHDRDQWKIFEEKKSQLENYDLKFDSNLSGFIENHVEFEQRRYREASFHVKAKLCGLTFSTTWQGKPVLESSPIDEWFYGTNGGGRISATQGRRADPLYYRKVKWGS